MKYFKIFRAPDGDGGGTVAGDNGGAGSNGNGAGAGSGGDGQGEKVLTFTTATLGERLARETRKAEEKALATLREKGNLIGDDEKDAYAEFKAAQAKKLAEQDGKKDDAHKAEAARLQKEAADAKAETERVRTESQSKLDRQSIEYAVSGAIANEAFRKDIGQSRLIQNVMGEIKFGLVDGKVYAIGEDGEPLYSRKPDANGAHMTAEEAITAWFEKNDWALEAKGLAGSGTTGNGQRIRIPANVTSGAAFDALSAEQKNAMLERDGFTIGGTPKRVGFQREQKART